MTTNTKTSNSGTIEVVPSDPAEDRENAIDAGSPACCRGMSSRTR